ncbi:MAG: hypothetical protein ACKO4R_12715, partial [Synechococcales cyanobacterium]
ILYICPHPLTPSPQTREEEPDSKSLSPSGRGMYPIVMLSLYPIRVIGLGKGSAVQHRILGWRYA